MQDIRKFDPWESRFCTCPEKYSFNPYTGCGHGCIYCYATYIPHFYQPRRKKNLLNRVKRDLDKIPPDSLISISNSSDPYIPLEAKFKDTRECLKLFQNKKVRILLITKSDLVVRDLDILRKLKVAVTISMSSLREEIYRRLEPKAPSPAARLTALKKLNREGIPTGLRIDPIFPYLTDGEVENILTEAAPHIKHVVCSTFKPRGDSWKRFNAAFPEVARKLEPLYFSKGSKIGRSYLLPNKLREEIFLRVKEVSSQYNLSFATCRENFPHLQDSLSCDGSHLLE